MEALSNVAADSCRPSAGDFSIFRWFPPTLQGSTRVCHEPYPEPVWITSLRHALRHEVQDSEANAQALCRGSHFTSLGHDICHLLSQTSIRLNRGTLGISPAA